MTSQWRRQMTDGAGSVWRTLVVGFRKDVYVWSTEFSRNVTKDHLRTGQCTIRVKNSQSVSGALLRSSLSHEPRCQITFLRDRTFGTPEFPHLCNCTRVSGSKFIEVTLSTFDPFSVPCSHVGSFPGRSSLQEGLGTGHLRVGGE